VVGDRGRRRWWRSGRRGGGEDGGGVVVGIPSSSFSRLRVWGGCAVGGARGRAGGKWREGVGGRESALCGELEGSREGEEGALLPFLLLMF